MKTLLARWIGWAALLVGCAGTQTTNPEPSFPSWVTVEQWDPESASRFTWYVQPDGAYMATVASGYVEPPTGGPCMEEPCLEPPPGPVLAAGPRRIGSISEDDRRALVDAVQASQLEIYAADALDIETIGFDRLGEMWTLTLIVDPLLAVQWFDMSASNQPETDAFLEVIRRLHRRYHAEGTVLAQDEAVAAARVWPRP